MKLKNIVAAGVAAVTLTSGLAINTAAADAVAAGTYYIRNVYTDNYLVYNDSVDGVTQTSEKQSSTQWIVKDERNGAVSIRPAGDPGYGWSFLDPGSEGDIFLSTGDNTSILWNVRKESGHVAILPNGTPQNRGRSYGAAAPESRGAKVGIKLVDASPETGYSVKFLWDFIPAPNSGATAAPTASPKPGTVQAGTYVTLSSATKGAAIYYTTDGSNPANSRTMEHYTGPIRIDSRTQIKAFATDMNNAFNSDSPVVEFVYEVSGQRVQKTAAPTANVAAGQVAAGTKVVLNSDTKGATIYYTTDGSDPIASKTRIRYSSPIVVKGGAQTIIKAMASAPGFADSDVSTFEYNKKKDAAPAPVSNPAGGQFQNGLAVTLAASGNAGNTVIYYTLDGSDPTTSNTRVKYTGAFAINQTAVLKAYTEAQGMANSQVVTYNFTIGPLPNMLIKLTIGKLDYTKNGTQAYFDVAPYIEPSSGRTMVPIRFIAQALDANVEWDNATSTDTITTLNGRTLKIVLNQQLPNGMGMAVLKQDRLFVPVRYVAEQLGADVKWDDSAKTVTITSK